VKRVLTAAILIPIVVLALFKAPLWLFTLLVFGVAMLAAHEYFGIVKAQGYRPFQVTSYALLSAWFLSIFGIAIWMLGQPGDPATTRMMRSGVFALSWFGLPTALVLGPLLLLIFSLSRDPLSHALPDAAVSYMLLPYIGFTLGLMSFLRNAPNGAVYLLFLMVLVWCGDIAAYYVGRAIGRHKLAPRVSPGKSWEGAIASVLSAAVVGVLAMYYIVPIADGFRRVHLLDTTRAVTQYPAPVAPPRGAPLWLAVLFAVTVNVAAQLGDLVESALKRGAGVKDSGTLLPGHGGVLDRIDALLFALPVGLIFYLAGLSQYFASV